MIFFKKAIPIGLWLAVVFCPTIYANDIRPSQGRINDSALLMIEFQNEWLGENAKLSKLMKDKVQFENSIRQAKKALDTARDIGLPVVHVGLMLNGNYAGLGGEHAKYGLRKAIQKYGTWKEDACKFADSFKPRRNEFIVAGRMGASGFSGSNLDDYLRRNKISRLYLAGYALHVCVESTLRDGHDRGYEVVLLKDATSAFTSEQRDYVLSNIVHHFGTDISVDEFVRMFGLSKGDS